MSGGAGRGSSHGKEDGGVRRMAELRRMAGPRRGDRSARRVRRMAGPSGGGRSAKRGGAVLT